MRELASNGVEKKRPIRNGSVELTPAQEQTLFAAYQKERRQKTEKNGPLIIFELRNDNSLVFASNSPQQGERLYANLKVSASVEEVLVRCHSDLPNYLARYASDGGSMIIDTDDLRQVGHLALLEAIQQYNPKDFSKGQSFRGFATTIIRNKLIDEVRKNGAAPRTHITEIQQVESVREDLRQELGGEPEQQIVEERLRASGKSRKQVSRMVDRAKIGRRIEMSYDVSRVANGTTLKDIFPSSDPSPEQLILEKLVPRDTIVQGAVATLSAEDRYILDAVYIQEKPYAELVDTFGVSESRISQLVKDIHQKLRLHPQLRAEWYGYVDESVPTTVFKPQERVSVSRKVREARNSLILDFLAAGDKSHKEIAAEVSYRLGGILVKAATVRSVSARVRKKETLSRNK